jgi:hypothetical protein
MCEKTPWLSLWNGQQIKTRNNINNKAASADAALLFLIINYLITLYFRLFSVIDFISVDNATTK